MGGSLIPNFLAQVADQMDPFQRDARSIMDGIRQRIPGEREKLARRIDLGGNPMASSAIIGDPFPASPQKSDPLAETMLRLGLDKSKPGRTIRDTELSSQDYESLSTFMGQARWKILTPLIQSPQFQAAMQQNPEAARALLNRQFETIGDEARTLWLYKHPQVLVQTLQGKLHPNKAVPSSYLH
jgi:hypothetical protein